MAQTKVTGGLISTTSNYEVGVITATKFVGPFGDSSDRGIGYFSSLDVTGNANIGGTLSYVDVDNITATGIITAQDSVQIGAGLSVAGISTFTGAVANFSGGVGIADSIFHIGDTNTAIRFPADDTITFETNGAEEVRINSNGQLILGSNPTVAADAALHIELDGTREYLRLEGDVGTSNAYLEIEAPNNRRKALIFKSGGTRRGIIGVGDSDEATDATSLFFSASDKIAGNDPHMVIASTGKIGINETTPEELLDLGENNQQNLKVGQRGYLGQAYSTAATILGHSVKAKTTGTTAGGMIVTETNSGGGAPSAIRQESGTIQFHTAASGTADADFDSEKVRITSTGRLGIGTGSPLGVAHVNVGGGSTEPFVIERSGSGESIWSMKPYAGNLYFRGGPAVANYATDRFAILYGGDNARGGDVAFFGTAAGITSCLWDASENELKFQDDSKAIYGAGDDLEIYHTAGGDSIIHHTATSGSTLRLRSRGFTFKNQANSETIATLNEGDACKLFYSNAEKIATTTTGISVTGEVAASQDYPNYRPTLDFNFAAVKKLDPRITYYRTGPASYTDEFGIVKLVGDNTPRFDHDPTTRESKGLLIEESRTNLFASSDAGHSAWILNGSITKEANTTDTKDPAGTYTACKLMSAASANSTSQIYDGLSHGSGGVQSLWAKKGTHNVLGIFDYGGGSGIRGWFDLNTGEHRCEGGTKVAAGVQSSGDDSNTTNMIEYPNGWYRCIYYENANMTYAHFRIVDFDADNEASASSNSIYVWGLQAEGSGEKFATSFIPCNTGLMPGTITRGADQVTVEGTEFTDFYNDLEGTFVVSHSILPEVPNAENCYVFEVSDGGATHVAFRYNDVNSSFSNKPAFSSIYSSSATASMNATGTYTRGAIVKGAMTAKVNSFKATWNGETVQTDTSGSVFGPGTTGQLAIGRYHPSAGYELNGHIQKMMYWPKQLSTNQLKTITS